MIKYKETLIAARRGFERQAYMKSRKITKTMIARLRRMKIFPRLLLVFCALLITSTLFITLFNQASYGRELETNVSRYLGVLSENAAMKLGKEKNRFEDFLLEITKDEALFEAAAENELLFMRENHGGVKVSEKINENSRLIESGLLSAKRRMQGVKALLLVTKTAQYRMASGADSPRGAYARDLPAFRRHDIYTLAEKADGYPVWRDSTADSSFILYDNEQDRLGIAGCITVSCRVFDPLSREPLGVLLCCIYPKHFTELLSEYARQDGLNTFVVGDGGMVEGIAATLDAPPFPPQRESFLKRVFYEHNGSLSLETEGKTLLASFSGDVGTPMHIVNLTYKDYALRQISRMGWINIFVVCAVIIIGSFFCYIAAASISRPVNRLIKAMKRVGAGDFSAAYRAESRDEIGVLCDEFDRMVEAMKELIDRVYVSEIREKELALNEKSAQLDAMQMQINPHFMYNTLDMIRWECMYENGAESPASDMIEKFCDLMRMSVKAGSSKETVEESLKHASTYLDVVNFRHTDKIKLEVQLSFDKKRYLIPRLCLQPIIENAVKHGFECANHESRVITIQGEKTRDGRLIIIVKDNGAGMTQEKLKEIREFLDSEEATQDNIGLRNVHRRCRLCYGESFGVSIESEKGSGTTVTLTIPAEEKDAEGKK